MAQAIGQLFFCKYFYVQVRSDKCKHYFVGRESNVITAMDMSVFVIKSIMAEANKRRRDEAHDWTWWTSFCKGAAERVIERCYDLRRAAEADSNADASRGTGTSLVLASYYKQELDANEQFLKDAGLRLRHKANREHGSRADGHYAGREHGNKISLSRQVGSNGSGNKRLK
jgi:hypothetical protein